MVRHESFNSKFAIDAYGVSETSEVGARENSHDLTFDHYLHPVFSFSTSHLRLLKTIFQQGRRREITGGVPSGAHGATNKEHHVCARRRVGEAAGSPLMIISIRERSWRSFSAAVRSTRPRRQETSADFPGRSVYH